MKKKRFPRDVARFFNPIKACKNGGWQWIIGTHQKEKMQERSNIPVYSKGGTARKVMDENGNVTYK